MRTTKRFLFKSTLIVVFILTVFMLPALTVGPSSSSSTPSSTTSKPRSQFVPYAPMTFNCSWSNAWSSATNNPIPGSAITYRNMIVDPSAELAEVSGWTKFTGTGYTGGTLNATSYYHSWGSYCLNLMGSNGMFYESPSVNMATTLTLAWAWWTDGAVNSAQQLRLNFTHSGTAYMLGFVHYTSGYADTATTKYIYFSDGTSTWYTHLFNVSSTIYSKFSFYTTSADTLNLLAIRTGLSSGKSVPGTLCTWVTMFSWVESMA